MSYANLFTLVESEPHANPFRPESAVVQTLWRDASKIDKALFCEVFWITKDCEADFLARHEVDEVFAFISGDFEDTENLKASVTLQIENDTLSLGETSFVFIPAGRAHGNIKVKLHSDKPIFCARAFFEQGMPESLPCEATAAPGTFTSENSVVQKYLRADGTLPNVPQGFLKLLLWLDGAKLKGAPYMEAVWFCTTKHREEGDSHSHEFDEFLACVGSDPQHPEQLGAQLHFFVEDEEFIMDKSFLLFLPAGVTHCPMFVTRMDRPFLHFTGGRPAAENYSGGPRS